MLPEVISHEKNSCGPGGRSSGGFAGRLCQVSRALRQRADPELVPVRLPVRFVLRRRRRRGLCVPERRQRCLGSASGSQAQAEQAQYTDKSYVGDVEEVSSYSFTLPEFSAPKSIADKLNTFYADVAQQMISYTQTDVYKKAQDLGAVGLLSGTYTVEQTDGSLKVTLSVSVNYAGAADAETHTRVDTFDPATGECTGTEKN
jgi:hypothetical protein